MNTKFTKDQLTAWITSIIKAAKEDEPFSIAWFKPTEDEALSIIAGWQECFADNSEVDDIFCCSKSNPRYVMCVKIAENDGPYDYTDYEIMNMPYDRVTKEVEDTEIMLEWDELVNPLADFLMQEFERLMETYGDNY